MDNRYTANNQIKSIGIIVFILITFIACQQEVKIPSQFIGVWQSSSPKYKDRYIEFTETELSYGLGGDEKKTHIITKINLEQKGAFQFYSFFYQDSEGEPWTFSVIYNPHYNDDVFQLKNGMEVWKRGL